MVRIRCAKCICNVCGVNTSFTILPTFTLPKDETNRNLWLDALGLCSSAYAPTKLTSHLHGPTADAGCSVMVISDFDAAAFSICGRHFLPSMFNRLPELGQVRRFTLKDHAIPLLVQPADWNRIFEWTSTMYPIEENVTDWIGTSEPLDKTRIPPPSVGEYSHIDHNYSNQLEDSDYSDSDSEKDDVGQPPVTAKRSKLTHSDSEQIGIGGISVKIEPADSLDMDIGACTSAIEVKEEMEDAISEDNHNDQHQTFLVEALKLSQLFSVCGTSGCGKPVPSSNVRTHLNGARITVYWKCIGDHQGQWSSGTDGKLANIIGNNHISKYRFRPVADSMHRVTRTESDQCKLQGSNQRNEIVKDILRLQQIDLKSLCQRSAGFYGQSSRKDVDTLKSVPKNKDSIRSNSGQRRKQYLW